MTALRSESQPRKPRFPDRRFNERSQITAWFSGGVLILLSMLLSPVAVHGQSSLDSQNAGVRDFVAYWAAARLLLNSQDPYSPSEILDLQRRVGLAEPHALMMWSPPWTFCFTLPFGLMDFSIGQFFWLLMHVFLILVSSGALWRMYGNPKDSVRWPWLLALTFVPSVFVLVIGQITPLVLAGLAAFVYCVNKRDDFIAGVALVFVSVKPHFIYLFWLLCLLWIYQQGRWRIVLGATIASLIAAAIPLLLDPMVYAQYLTLLQRADIQLPMDLAAPTLRNVGKKFFQTRDPWLQFSLSAVTCLWSVYYWRRHRENWQWLERLPLILMVSLVTSAYFWTFDQIVFLPAILQAATWARHRNRPWFTSGAVVIYVLIEISHILLRFVVAQDIWYFWLAPALLGNYLVFCREAR